MYDNDEEEDDTQMKSVSQQSQDMFESSQETPTSQLINFLLEDKNIFFKIKFDKNFLLFHNPRKYLFVFRTYYCIPFSVN